MNEAMQFDEYFDAVNRYSQALLDMESDGAKEMANICKVVLLFAIKVTFTGLLPCFSVKSCLNEEIAISLETIIIDGTISKMLLAWEIKYKSVRIIKSLSATKSNNAPKLLVESVFLAI